MTEIQEHPATGFDVEGWLQDAHMPEQSVDVYKRADVIGELSALRRKLEVLREASEGGEKSAGESSEVLVLEERCKNLIETFASSQLTVYARAVSPDEKRTLREESDARTKGSTNPLESNKDFGYSLLARSIVAVRPFEGERTLVNWTHTQVQAMENAIGPFQTQAILEAHQTAQNTLPYVDADFLHKPSGEGDGQE